MAKSAPKRRLNRRAKRSIRRTMAAVMLITSIVVAAIPVPEAAAVDAGGGGTVTPTQPTPVSYPAAFDKFDIKHDMVASLDKTEKTENPAYTVTQLSDGQWQLEWQFKFFAENGQRGVISEYNSTYFSKEVTLNPNVKMAYEVVEKDTYNDFYENTVANLKYEITYQQYIDKLEPQAAKPFFDKYFPGAYEARAKIWDKYTEDLAKWEALIPEEQAKLPKPELKPGEETLSMGPQDLTKEQKLEFYCFYQDTYPGATLVEVIDYRKGVSYPNTLAYMPKGGNGETKDENGFLV